MKNAIDLSPVWTFSKYAFVLLLLCLLAAGQQAGAATDTIDWLDLTSGVPHNASVPNGQTFLLPGYNGTVSFSYTSTTLNWENSPYNPMQNGQVIDAGGNYYGWGPVNGYFDSDNANDLRALPIDYNLTFTFNGPPVPGGQLVLASLGLGQDNEGWSTVTVTNSGTFLGDWDLVEPNELFAATGFASGTLPGGAPFFTLSNSVAQPAAGFFNTDFGVTLINDPVSSITLAVHHIGGDGFGFTVGLLQPDPCGDGPCLRIYTPGDIVVTTCSNSLPVSYDMNVTDACFTNSPTLVCDPPPGTDFPLGTTTVTCTAEDAYSTNQCSFTVTVAPMTNLPVITASPTNITLCNNKILAGAIIMDNDEWVFSNQGFTNEGELNGQAYATNCAAYLTGGKGSNILIYSDNFGLTSVDLEKALLFAGYKVTLNTALSPALTLSYLSMFNAVFVGGDPLDPASVQALENYVCSGGGVYVAAGTGTIPGGAPGEAAQWNPLLNPFGLTLASGYNSLSGDFPISSSNPILAGVTQLYIGIGQDVSVLPDNSSPAQIIASSGTDGLIGVSACSTGCVQMPDETGMVSVLGVVGPVTQSIPPGTTICSSTNVVFTATNSCGVATDVCVPVTLVPCTNCLQVYCPPDSVLSILCTNLVSVTNDGTSFRLLWGTNVATYTPTVISDCCSNWTLSFSEPSETLAVGTTNILTCTVSGCGMTNSCSFSVGIQCYSPPITSWPSNIVIYTSNGCGQMPLETNNPAWWATNLGTVSVTQSITFGTTLCTTPMNILETNMVFTVVNCCGQTSNYNATVFVEPKPVALPATTNGNFYLNWQTFGEPWNLEQTTNFHIWTPVTNISNIYDPTNLIYSSSYSLTNLNTAPPYDFFRLYLPSTNNTN